MRRAIVPSPPAPPQHGRQLPTTSLGVHPLFERRLSAVRHEFPGVLAGEAEALHKMRVASRRLREAVPLLESAGGGDDADPRADRRIVRSLRRLTRALGGVRELDVALALLAEFESARASLGGAVATVSQVIRWEREIRRRAMMQRIDEARVSKIERRIAARLVDIRVSGTDAAWGPRLGQRIARRAAAVDAAVQAAGSLYAPDRLHGVRIAAKKLRYALELAREARGVPTLGSIRRLKRMQDLLGRMHDLEVLAGYARLLDDQGGARGRLHARIGLLLDAIDKEVRLLHAHYLGRRALLAEVTGRCETVYCPKLQSAGVPDRPRGSRGVNPGETHERNHRAVRRAPRHRSRARRRVS